MLLKLEEILTNYYTSASDFSSGWTLGNLSKTTGQSDPDGGNDASLFTVTSGGNYRSLRALSDRPGKRCTHYMTAKQGTQKYLMLYHGSAAGTTWNLDTGVVEKLGDEDGVISADIIDLGAGWYELSCDVLTAVDLYPYWVVVNGINTVASTLNDSVYLHNAYGILESNHPRKGSMSSTQAKDIPFSMTRDIA